MHLDQTSLLQRDVVDSVLSFKLNNLQLAVKPECAVLSAHASVEQLVEVDIAVITPDSHLEHDLFHLVICGLRW